MAHETVFRIARLGDRQVLELFDQLQSELPDGIVRVRGPGNLIIPTADLEALELPRGSHFLQGADLASKTSLMHVFFRRGIIDHESQGRVPSPYFDEIELSLNVQNSRQKPEISKLLTISQLIESFGTVVEPEVKSTDFGGATDIISAEVAKLAELAADLTVKADETRRELEAEKRKNADTLRAKLEELNQEFENKEENLKKKQENLDDVRKSLDDREHKHVRRQLRETITDSLLGEIDSPSKAAAGRNYSTRGMFLAGIGTLALAYLALQAQLTIASLPMDTTRDPQTGGIVSTSLSSSPQVYLQYFKLFITSTAALGMLVYLISWMRRLATDANHYQQQQQRYAFDMNRASWTIETILELSASELPEIPEIWLESVTRDLFSTSDAKNEDASSLQALGALLNVTSEAEIGPDGPKFKLNRRGAKKAASEVGD